MGKLVLYGGIIALGLATIRYPQILWVTLLIWLEVFLGAMYARRKWKSRFAKPDGRTFLWFRLAAGTTALLCTWAFKGFLVGAMVAIPGLFLFLIAEVILCHYQPQHM